jgi:hypothetical protein
MMFNCFNNISISANGTHEINVGGIVGNGGNVQNSFNLGNISSTSGTNVNAGGIGGSGVTVGNSFNRGNVNAHTGGAFNTVFAGGITGNQGSANNSYSTGNISSTRSFNYHTSELTRAGGVAGAVTATNSFWNSDNTQIRRSGSQGRNNNLMGVGNGTATNVESLTTVQMRSQANFAGWDFVNTWTMAGNRNDGYPVLQSAAAFLEYLPIIGDVDNNGEIQVQDAIAILRHMVGLPSQIEEGNRAWQAAIITGGSAPQVQDAIAILRRLVGLPSALD